MTGQEDLQELPHYVTENEYLGRLDPEELSKIRANIIRALIRKRSFESARLLEKYWLVIIDATQLHSFRERNDGYCLSRTTVNKETGEETTTYSHNVLEAKIVLGDNLIV